MKFVEKTPGFLNQLKSEIESDVQLAHSKMIIAQLGAKTNSTEENIVSVADGLNAQQVIDECISGNLKHLMQAGACSLKHSIAVLDKFLNDSKNYFEKNVEIINGDHSKKIEINIENKQQKSNAKNTIQNFLSSYCTQSELEAIDTLFEEMYMNSMIDAPSEYKKLGLADEKKEDILFKLSINDEQIVLSCKDYYGSLSPSKVLNRLKQVYLQGAGVAMNRGAGGAGLGCYIMFETASSMYIGVKKGECSVVTCVLPFGKSNRQRVVVKKSIHIFE